MMQVIYPLEVIRRRMQVSSTKTVGNATGLFSFIKLLTVKELFAGLTATYLKVIPAAAISLLARDAILGRLQK